MKDYITVHSIEYTVCNYYYIHCIIPYMKFQFCCFLGQVSNLKTLYLFSDHLPSKLAISVSEKKSEYQRNIYVMSTIFISDMEHLILAWITEPFAANASSIFAYKLS